MSSIPYNGFTGPERDAAQSWLRSEWKAGRLARPKRCCACGTEHGRIDAHAEDYSRPYAAGKTDEYHLCVRCHYQVHARLKRPERWRVFLAGLPASGLALMRMLHARSLTVPRRGWPDAND